MKELWRKAFLLGYDHLPHSDRKKDDIREVKISATAVTSSHNGCGHAFWKHTGARVIRVKINLNRWFEGGGEKGELFKC